MKKFNKLLTCVAAFSLVLSLGLAACTPAVENPNDGDDEGKTEVTLTKIELDTENVKTEYEVGDLFDATGLVVTAVYSDESTKAVTDYTYSPNGALAVTDTTVTVSYESKTADIAITVTEKSDNPEVTLTKIELDTENVKTEYEVGDTFDPTGLVVTAVYSDESTKAVTDYTYSPNGALAVTDTTVTVSYEGKTANIAITVTEKSENPDKPGDEIPEIEGIDARWIGSWQEEDKFFDASAWTVTELKDKDGTVKDTTVLPTLAEDGSIEITSNSRTPSNYMGIYNESGALRNPIHNNADHDEIIGQDVVYTMLVKTEGHFGMMLFAGSNIGWNTTDQYQAVFFEYNEGAVTFKARQNTGAVVASGTAELSADEFTRIDFIFTRISSTDCEMRFYVGGELVVLEGSAASDEGVVTYSTNGYGYFLQFVSLDDTTLWIAAPAAEEEPEIPVEKTYEIDSTSMTVVEEDGKVYLTVSGTYTGYTEEDFAMDVQFVGGAWPNYGDWTNIVVLENGTFTIKYDVTVAGPGEYVAHVFVGGASNDTGFNTLPASFGGTATAGTKTYTLGTDEKGWGFQYTVTLTVVDTSAKEVKINAASFDLVAEGDKALVKLTVETTDFDSEDDLKAYLAYGNTDGAYEWKTDCYKVEKVEDGVYNVYFDITDMVAGGDGQLWSNVYLKGVKTEIKDPTHASHGKSITVGGKTYTVVCTGANGTWDIPCITVS